jgi:hypothetical protein
MSPFIKYGIKEVTVDFADGLVWERSLLLRRVQGLAALCCKNTRAETQVVELF